MCYMLICRLCYVQILVCLVRNLIGPRLAVGGPFQGALKGSHTRKDRHVLGINMYVLKAEPMVKLSWYQM